MLRPLHRAYLLIAFAILPIGNASVVAPKGSRNFSSPIHIRAAAESTAATRSKQAAAGPSWRAARALAGL